MKLRSCKGTKIQRTDRTELLHAQGWLLAYVVCTQPYQILPNLLDGYFVICLNRKLVSLLRKPSHFIKVSYRSYIYQVS